MTTADRLTRARTHLLLDQPFFGTLALRMPLIPDVSEETAVTDGRTIQYNPNFIDGLTDSQLKGLFAHLILHIANGHTWRRGERDIETWNKAGDYAINHLLTQAGFDLPPGALVNSSFSGSAEAVYNVLQMNKAQGGQGQPGQGTGAGQAGKGPKTPSQSKAGTAEGKGNDKGSKGPKDAKKGPSNKAQAPSKGPTPDPGRCGAVKDAPADEKKDLENDWRVAVAQAAALGQGDLPAELQRMIGEFIEPQVPWTVLLRDFVERTARNDYSWSRVNPRHVQRGFMLPTLISEELPAIVLAVDTSCSIDQATLDRFASEASAVLGAYETTIHVVYVDARVQGTQIFTRADLPLKLEPKGGGGTRFEPAFDWIREQGLEPSCVIYLTDLLGSFPATEPEWPVLWVATTERAAPFGQVARLET